LLFRNSRGKYGAQGKKNQHAQKKKIPNPQTKQNSKKVIEWIQLQHSSPDEATGRQKPMLDHHKWHYIKT